MSYTTKVMCQSLTVYGIGTEHEHVKALFAGRKQGKLRALQDLQLAMSVDPLTAERFAVNKPFILTLEEEDQD